MLPACLPTYVLLVPIFLCPVSPSILKNQSFGFSSAANSAAHLQTNLVSKTEIGGWTSVKSEKATFASNMPTMKHKQKDVLSNRKVFLLFLVPFCSPCGNR